MRHPSGVQPWGWLRTRVAQSPPPLAKSRPPLRGSETAASTGHPPDPELETLPRATHERRPPRLPPHVRRRGGRRQRLRVAEGARRQPRRGEAGQVVHPAVDGRRHEPQGHPRPEAGQQGGRRLQADQDPAPRASKSANTCPSWPSGCTWARWCGACPPRRGAPAGQVPPAHRLPRGPGRAALPQPRATASAEIGKASASVPNFVSIGGRSYGSGYLGPKHQPLMVTGRRQAAWRI